MSVSNRLDGLDRDFWKMASLCLGVFAVAGCFNSSYKDALNVVGGVCSMCMPWVLAFIYRKSNRESEMNGFFLFIICVLSMAILGGINCWCIHWVVELDNLKYPEGGKSWLGWFVENYDANSAATLFVGLQWCALYVLKGCLLGEFNEHLKRVKRVGFMLLGALISALGLPWGFPFLVALGELIFSSRDKMVET